MRQSPKIYHSHNEMSYSGNGIHYSTKIVLRRYWEHITIPRQYMKPLINAANGSSMIGSLVKVRTKGIKYNKLPNFFVIAYNI